MDVGAKCFLVILTKRKFCLFCVSYSNSLTVSPIPTKNVCTSAGCTSFDLKGGCSCGWPPAPLEWRQVTAAHASPASICPFTAVERPLKFRHLMTRQGRWCCVYTPAPLVVQRIAINGDWQYWLEGRKKNYHIDRSENSNGISRDRSRTIKLTYLPRNTN